MMKNTYLKPSVEILQLETGAFMDNLNITSLPLYDGPVGAKRRNTDTDSTDPDAPQPVAPSIWDD